MKTIALIIIVISVTVYLTITGLQTINTVESIATARYATVEAIN